MDKFTKKKRSEIMSKIRSQNTQIEIYVFQELSRRKIYFQKYYRGVSGSPDIALPRKKRAVFIDGDFWHGYRFSKLKLRLPKKYWLNKIKKNIQRDHTNTIRLKRNGWKVVRVWEHELLKSFNSSMDKIADFLREGD